MIRENQQLFEIGVHGPDILFYFMPFSSWPWREVGSRMHQQSGREYFTQAGNTLCSRGEREAELAFLYGFLCHFALDSICHPYIEEQAARGVTSHDEMEGEFERYLLLEDGLEPTSQHLASHIHPSLNNAQTIAPYFPAGAAVIRHSLRAFIFYHELMRCPGKKKRRVIVTGMKITGQYVTLRGHMINDVPDPDCTQTNPALRQLYDRALPLAAEMIEEFLPCARGHEPWPEAFDLDFSGEKPEGRWKG